MRTQDGAARSITSGPRSFRILATVDVRAQSIEELFDVPVERFLRRTQGRETFAAHLRGVRVIVKRLAGRRDARREHDALDALRALALRVPQPLGWCAERDGLRRSVVVIEEIPHERTLREVLQLDGPSRRDARLAELATLVARMHDAGWHHRDLYVQHLLVDTRDDSLVLIDAGRARRVLRSRWFVKDLAAVLHSLPPNVAPREAMRFLARYLDARGIVRRAARRRWIARARSKAARIAAHVPLDERDAEARACV